MKSPFPGMDPYLESRWADVHSALITSIRESLQPILPRELRARAEERILLEETEDHQALRGYRTDIAVIDSGRRDISAPTASSAASVAEPTLIDFYSDLPVDRFVQIIDTTSGNRVITAIEVLSPGNKLSGRLNDDYKQKLDDYVRADTNIVEIDLLRSSRGRLPVGQEDLQPEKRTPYLVCTRRASRSWRWEVYSLPLRLPLPAIPIPLRKQDADVILELQPLIDRVYFGGGHDDIDYSKPANPPLGADDDRWADDLLRQAGRR